MTTPVSVDTSITTPLALHSTIYRGGFLAPARTTMQFSDPDLPDRDTLDPFVLAAVGDPRSALAKCDELSASRPPAAAASTSK